jgi:hypothetical protein
MKKRRSDIPSRTGIVESRRFKTYWNIVYTMAQKSLTVRVTRPHSHNPSLPPLNLRGGEVGLKDVVFLPLR